MDNSLFCLTTIRYDNTSYEELLNWKEKHNIMGSYYGVRKEISDDIKRYKYTFIIEMHNELNKIMGIGCILTKTLCKKNINIHKDKNKNRFVYTSKYHLSIDKMIELRMNALIYFLEYVLFKGYSHQKRNIGITKLNEKILVDHLHIKKKKVYRCKICNKVKKFHICDKKLHCKPIQNKTIKKTTFNKEERKIIGIVNKKMFALAKYFKIINDCNII